MLGRAGLCCWHGCRNFSSEVPIQEAGRSGLAGLTMVSELSEIKYALRILK